MPDSFGGIWGLLGGIGGGTPRPPTGGIIVFLTVAVDPAAPTLPPSAASDDPIAGLPVAGEEDAFRTVAICIGARVFTRYSQCRWLLVFFWWKRQEICGVEVFNEINGMIFFLVFSFFVCLF